MQKLKVTIKKNEEKILPIIWINNQDKELILEASLVGEGANLTILGVILGKAQDQFVLRSNIYHQAPRTKSRVNIRGVLYNQAQFDNEGLIHIKKGAKGADGFFQARVLLFDQSRGRSFPSLEIDENEVKAGHAATTGQVDESLLFYLQSRGLKREEAEKIIISGFFEPVIKELSQKDQLKVKKVLEAKLR